MTDKTSPIRSNLAAATGIDFESPIAESIKTPFVQLMLTDSANWLTWACNNLAEQSGWWVDAETKQDVRTWEDKYKFQLWVLVKIALIASEAFEGFEGHRKDKMDDHLPQFKMMHVEIADAIIRAFDLAGGLGVPLAEIIVAKLQYNSQRADHKLENRVKEGGKSV